MSVLVVAEMGLKWRVRLLYGDLAKRFNLL